MDDTWARLQEILGGYWDTTLEYLPRVAMAVVIVALGYLLANLITNFIRKRLNREAQDTIAATFLTKVAKGLLVFAVFMLALNVAGLGNISAALLGALGASTLILGFAFKDIGENFIAGVILAFSRPFSIGDAIEVNDVFGKVVALKFRYTHLKTFDGKDVYVPNADVMTNSVTNYTADGFIRQEFVIGIAYEDTIDEAIALVDKLVEEYPDIINTPEHPSFSCVDELAASTVNIKVRFWIETKEFRRRALEARGKFIRVVKERLADEGFGLPADITELKIYGSETSIPISLKEVPDSMGRKRA